MKIIPAIDVKDGKCVRLYQGDFEQTTEYSADPTAIATVFSALNVDDLHLVDLDGARSGEQCNSSIVAAIADDSDMDIQLGGGIRNRDDVARWLAAGVKRCVIGSVSVEDPAMVRAWIDEFGTNSIVLALDVRIAPDKTPMLTTHGWTSASGVSLWDCVDAYYHSGVRQVLCTDVARDGAMSGPNFQLYSDILTRYPELELQASGGVRSLADLAQLRKLGLHAAITGRALLDGAITADEVASFRRKE